MQGMASGVSVERTALQSGIGVCKTCIHELADASRTLKRDYQSAGSGWKDQQYARLGGIIEECCSALEKPISELEGCQASLEKLLSAVSAYEEVKVVFLTHFLICLPWLVFLKLEAKYIIRIVWILLDIQSNWKKCIGTKVQKMKRLYFGLV